MIEQQLLVNSCAIITSSHAINRNFESLVGDQRVTEATNRIVCGCVNSVGAHGQGLVTSGAERQPCQGHRIYIAASESEFRKDALTYEF
ncbi:hypothetical protein D3C71_2030540 [compost metagenome]